MLPRALLGHALPPCRASELTMSASSFSSYQSDDTATAGLVAGLRAEIEALRRENLLVIGSLQTYQDAFRAVCTTMVGVDEANARLNLEHQLQALRRTAQLPPVDSVDDAAASSGDSRGYTLGLPAAPARAASHSSPSLRTPESRSSSPEQRVVPVWVEPNPEPSLDCEGPDYWVPPPPEGLPPPEQGGGVPVVVHRTSPRLDPPPPAYPPPHGLRPLAKCHRCDFFENRKGYCRGTTGYCCYNCMHNLPGHGPWCQGLSLSRNCGVR